MREHQIVITLKPDQFLEVQRLARASNAKSMGIFVRQKLLAALGVEGAASPDPATGLPDVGPIVDNLRRLHTELRSFVAESLSIALPESAAQPHEALPLTIEAVNAPSTGFDDEEDEIEEAANRAFSISPRLGATVPGSENLLPPADSRKSQSSAPHQRHEPHRSRSEVDATQQSTAAMPPYATPSMRDPLSDLLGPEEVIGRPKAEIEELDTDDDFEFILQMELAERQRQKNAELPPEDRQSQTDDLNTDNVQAASQAQDIDQTPASEPGQIADSQVPGGSAPTNQDPANRSSDLPLSGGPPPKRRRV